MDDLSFVDSPEITANICPDCGNVVLLCRGQKGVTFARWHISPATADKLGVMLMKASTEAMSAPRCNPSMVHG